VEDKDRTLKTAGLRHPKAFFEIKMRPPAGAIRFIIVGIARERG
jgi:hypothetical protein